MGSTKSICVCIRYSRQFILQLIKTNSNYPNNDEWIEVDDGEDSVERKM